MYVCDPMRFDRNLSGDYGEYWQKEARNTIAEAVEKFQSGEIVVDASGILRWDNGNIIGYDLAHICQLAGIVFDADATRRAERDETRAFMQEYIKVRANRTFSREERDEMRNAFGAGARVVDVITGQTFTV